MNKGESIKDPVALSQALLDCWVDRNVVALRIIIIIIIISSSALNEQR
jgi:hypothetical protein